MKTSDTDAELIDLDTRLALLEEVAALRNHPRRDIAKLERLAAPLQKHAGNWLAARTSSDDAFLARLIRTLIHVRSTHAFILKQDGFENKTGCIVALSNLVHASQSEEWEAFDKANDRRIPDGEQWLTFVLRGLFCFHWIYPRVHGKMANLFRIDRARDLSEIFERVLEHFELFFNELKKMQGDRKALVDVLPAELADTVQGLERLRNTMPQTTKFRRRQELSPMVLARAGKR